ncbi:hypothetical protein FB451DRAFT_1191477 [Mycena latifolia]|nr:hypothetical protein FB451DRAFT_1191477 [Mycena latifolia]
MEEKFPSCSKLPIAFYLGCSTLNAGRPSAPFQVSAVFSIPPQSATSRWRPLEWVQRVYDETPRVSARKSLPTAYRRARGTVPRRTPTQCRPLHRRTVTAHLATPTTTASVGKPYCKVFMIRVCLEVAPRRAVLRRRVEEQIPHVPAVRVSPAGPLLALPADDCVCMFAPHLFCVDENPRLTGCTRIAYLVCESTLRASYSILFGVFHHAIPATPLSLGTRSNNRRSSFHTSSSVIVRAHTHPHLNHQEGPGTRTDHLPQRRRQFPCR